MLKYLRYIACGFGGWIRLGDEMNRSEDPFDESRSTTSLGA
jgi:hypothetical protein